MDLLNAILYDTRNFRNEYSVKWKNDVIEYPAEI